MSASQAERRGFKSRPSLSILMPALAKLNIVLFVISFIAGCATTTKQEHLTVLKTEKRGIYHKVKSGETVWRIAKTYDVSVNEIVKSNSIPNIAQIEKDQLVFIPGAEKVLEVTSDIDDVKTIDFIWPIKGKILYYFGDRRGPRFNKGIDIQSAEGDTVRASREGRVVFADHLNGYGQTVILDHSDGFYTIYSQNAMLLVKVDDAVSQGQPIARLGKSGNLAYLHFEIRKNAVADNPLYYLP